MQFVKVERNELIKQLKEYIALLKKCPKGMEFHTCMEFCGIDKEFLKIAKVYTEKTMKEAAKKQQEENEQEGNI